MLYINEQKVASLSDATMLVDEYMLKHKSVFSGSSVAADKPRSILSSPSSQPSRRQNVGNSHRQSRMRRHQKELARLNQSHPLTQGLKCQWMRVLNWSPLMDLYP